MILRIKTWTKLLLVFCICFTKTANADPTSNGSRELSELQGNYQKAKDRAIAPIARKYEAELRQLKEKLTRAANLDAAIEVDAELERHLKEHSSSNSSAVVSSIPQGVTADITELKSGAVYSNNRRYKIANVPKQLVGLNFLRMEAGENGDYKVKFEGKSTARLLLVVSRASPVDGNELEKDGWRRTGLLITHDVNSTMMVFEREVENEIIKIKSLGDWPYMIATDVPMTIDSAYKNG